MKVTVPVGGRAILTVSVLSLALTLTAAPLELISLRDTSQPAPAGGSGDSWGGIISPDGRYVLFASRANNLVPTTNGNALLVDGTARLNVFLRDRLKGTTTLVSQNLAGDGGGNGDSIPTALSRKGRYACFESSASNLVPGDTNGVTDVFVRDLVKQTTILVSASTNGGVGNGACRGSVMTPDGRYVAFVSAATSLVPDDTNGLADVFVRDLKSGVTTLVSVGAEGTNAQPYGGLLPLPSSEAPEITPNGRYVAFYSSATNLVPGVSSQGEIFVRDLAAGTTVWASTGSRSHLGTTNAVSYNHAISEDGQFVAYEASTNTPLLLGSNQRWGMVLRFNLATELTDLVHTNSFASSANPEEIQSLAMTPDGQSIAFVANTTNRLGSAIYLWNAISNTLTLVSADRNGALATNCTCDSPQLDRAGRFVAFVSNATNLVSNPLVGDYHLYLRDTEAGVTTLIGVDTNGVGTSANPSTVPRMSSHARLVVFESLYASLVANDRNHEYDLFIHRRADGANELISARDPSLGSASANGPSLVAESSVSADGRFVVFSSGADNLVANDTNGFRDVFVRDLMAGSTLLASVGLDGVAAKGLSYEPAISENGRYVAFTSSAKDLVPGDTNGQNDVFVRDLEASTTILVSTNSNGIGGGDAGSHAPTIGADGRFVLFHSSASNLAPGGFLGENLFIRDLQSNITHALTTIGVTAAAMTADGRFTAFGDKLGNLFVWDSLVGHTVYTNNTSTISTVGISPDGSRLVYGTTNGTFVSDLAAQTNSRLGAWPLAAANRVGLHFSADSRFLTYARPLNGRNQAYLYDFQTGDQLLVSRTFGGTPGSGLSDSPDISADGRFVVYRSAATNLVPDLETDGRPNLYLFDRTIGSNSLLTASLYQDGSANNRSSAPVFSADGRTLVFQSFASDLAEQDFNHESDVFLLSFLYASISAVPAGQGPTLTWPARKGEKYQVQFKNALSDNTWHPVGGEVKITGNQAQLTDMTAGVGQRFYRIVTSKGQPH
jgi:Tol biopolymer transport system component